MQSLEDLRGEGSGARFLLSAACFVVIVAGLKLAEAILTTFLLSLFLAMLTIPVLRWLQEKRVPSGAAVLMVIVGLLALFALVGILVGGSLNQFLMALPTYRENLQARLEELLGPVVDMLTARGYILPELDPMKLFDLGTVLGPALQVVSRTLTGMALIFSNVFMVLLTTVFILSEAAGFPKKARAAVAQMGVGRESLNRFSKITGQVREYLVIKTLVSAVTGLFVGFWCWAWGVDFAVLWGLLGFLLNYIPTIGSIIAAIPPVALALIAGEGLGTALGVVAGYVAANMLLGNVVEPRLMGQRLGLSSLVVLLSLAFWGYVWGGLGMLLSVPLTMVVKILLENSDDLRWVAVLLSNAESVEAAEEGP